PGTPPAPVRVQQRLPGPADQARVGAQRAVTRRAAGGDHRAAAPSLVRRHAIPSGVQLAPAPAPPAVPGIHASGAAAYGRRMTQPMQTIEIAGLNVGEGLPHLA